MIPETLRESLLRYAESHVPTGGFLAAVLANDLFGAAGRADDVNGRLLPEICTWIYCNLPANSYGSPEAVAAWTSCRVVRT